jgi:hypothetical protein
MNEGQAATLRFSRRDEAFRVWCSERNATIDSQPDDVQLALYFEFCREMAS